MRALLPLAVLVLALASSAAEPRRLDTFVNEFKADPAAAKANYRGKKVTLEIEVLKLVNESGKPYHQAVAADAPKNSRVLFRLPKSYRPTDKLIVTATLKSSTWEKDEKSMYFDPCEVDKEVQVLPPQYTSLELLKKYDGGKNKKAAEEMVGKPIDIKGMVRFVKGTSVILEFVPLTDAKGKVVTDKQGFEKLGRALVTLTFGDGSVKKASLAKGMEIEARGVVESMQSGAITIKDAQLLSK